MQRKERVCRIKKTVDDESIIVYKLNIVYTKL